VVIRGYEYGRGQFVTFTAEELNAIDVESSKVIDLESLCREAISIRSISTVHTTLYPDCSIAVETLRMIGAAMAEGDLR
jgi:non-homologous end joining protein Ku